MALTLIFMISPRSILLQIFRMPYTANIFADKNLEIRKPVAESDNYLTKSEKKRGLKAPLLSDSIGRVKVPIKASYGTDLQLVEKILGDIAGLNPVS